MPRKLQGWQQVLHNSQSCLLHINRGAIVHIGPAEAGGLHCSQKLLVTWCQTKPHWPQQTLSLRLQPWVLQATVWPILTSVTLLLGCCCCHWCQLQLEPPYLFLNVREANSQLRTFFWALWCSLQSFTLLFPQGAGLPWAWLIHMGCGHHSP